MKVVQVFQAALLTLLKQDQKNLFNTHKNINCFGFFFFASARKVKVTSRLMQLHIDFQAFKPDAALTDEVRGHHARRQFNHCVFCAFAVLDFI